MVRTLLIGATLATALPAAANPAAQGLRIQLVVLAPDTPGPDATAAPHQRNDARELPPQLRDLAPGHAREGNEAAVAPLTFIY